MNAQHVINRLGNRRRRCVRRIAEINGDKVAALSRAEALKNDPDLSGMDRQIHLLSFRIAEIEERI